MDGLVLTQIAGWSSPVARRAHNPKVASSNLAPATKYIKGLQRLQPLFFQWKGRFFVFSSRGYPIRASFPSVKIPLDCFS